jgi:hypothetical protein
MCLACYNTDEMRGTKLELEHFLHQHGVDIFLLSEAFLKPGEAFRLASYVCHHRDRMTAGRYSHLGTPWFSPPLSARSGLDQLGGYCHSSHIGPQTSEKTEA